MKYFHQEEERLCGTTKNFGHKQYCEKAHTKNGNICKKSCCRIAPPYVFDANYDDTQNIELNKEQEFKLIGIQYDAVQILQSI